MDSTSNERSESPLRRSRLLPSASLVVGTLGLASTPALAAERPAICAKSFDPYKASPATRKACGIKSFPLTSRITHPDGSTEYTYIIDGHSATTLLPPPGFNAATASPAQRARYGIPTEPPTTAPVARAHWQEMINKLHFVPPAPELVQIPVRANGTSANWSGYENTAASNAFTQAYGEYLEPSDQGTSCSGNSAVFWSGLGGVNSGNLAQDGTGINTPGLGQHQAWWEILPLSIQPVKNLSATSGQYFESETQWLGTDSQGHNVFHFFLANVSTGAGASFDETTSSGFDGTTAEYIAERPSVNNSFTPLTNFGQFYQSAALTNGFRVQDFSGHTAVDMHNGSDLLASTGSLFNSGGFFVNWQACS